MERILVLRAEFVQIYEFFFNSSCSKKNFLCGQKFPVQRKMRKFLKKNRKIFGKVLDKLNGGGA
jgi:hypothetical protein